MYKTTHIIRLCLLLLIVLSINACDGRKSSQQALKEHVEAFKSDIRLEVEEYYPEESSVVVNDTLLTSGHSISIKTYSDMENCVTLTRIKDSVNYQKHYRNFIFEVELRNDSDLIFKEQFTRNRILNLVEDATVHDLQSVLKTIDLNYIETTADQVYINLMYEVPETHQRSSFELSLHKNGRIQIERK